MDKETLQTKINDELQRQASSNNPAWVAERILPGTMVRINKDAVIDAVDDHGHFVSSPYEDGYGYKDIVNSEEAKVYLGQTGMVVDQGPNHQAILVMDDGAMVCMLHRDGVTLLSVKDDVMQ